MPCALEVCALHAFEELGVMRSYWSNFWEAAAVQCPKHICGACSTCEEQRRRVSRGSTVDIMRAEEGRGMFGTRPE